MRIVRPFARVNCFDASNRSFPTQGVQQRWSNYRKACPLSQDRSWPSFVFSGHFCYWVGSFSMVNPWKSDDSTKATPGLFIAFHSSRSNEVQGGHNVRLERISYATASRTSFIINYGL